MVSSDASPRSAKRSARQRSRQHCHQLGDLPRVAGGVGRDATAEPTGSIIRDVPSGNTRKVVSPLPLNKTLILKCPFSHLGRTFPTRGCLAISAQASVPSAPMPNAAIPPQMNSLLFMCFAMPPSSTSRRRREGWRPSRFRIRRRTDGSRRASVPSAPSRRRRPASR